MADLMTTAVVMKQAQLYDQISMSALKMQMEAQQKVAEMLMENARLIAETSQQAAARGGINIYV